MYIVYFGCKGAGKVIAALLHTLLEMNEGVGGGGCCSEKG